MSTTATQTAVDLPTKLDEILDQIGSALAAPETCYSDLSELDREVAQIRERLRAAKSEANETLLNPGRPRDELRAAKGALEEIELDLSRLEHTAAKLDRELEERILAEREEARATAYEAALASRDALVAEIKGPAADHIAALVNLNRRLMDCDEAIDTVNRDLPVGRDRICRPEGAARGFSDYDDEAPATAAAFRLTQQQLADVRTPDGMAWPPLNWNMHVRGPGRALSYGKIKAAWRRTTR